MLYLITGINGVGKSTFINELINTTEGFDVIQGSAELMKALKLRIGDYEKLRDFDNKTKNNILKRIILNANKKYGDSLSKHAVMDAHILNIKNGKITQVMDNSMIRMFTAVIYLYAKTNDILERIEKDNLVRDRSIFGRGGKWENVISFDLYRKIFENTLKKECLAANTVLRKIPHFNNKTYLALQTFDTLHKQILGKASSALS